jgi:hypothetical protein
MLKRHLPDSQHRVFRHYSSVLHPDTQKFHCRCFFFLICLFSCRTLGDVRLGCSLDNIIKSKTQKDESHHPTKDYGREHEQFFQRRVGQGRCITPDSNHIDCVCQKSPAGPQIHQALPEPSLMQILTQF